MSDAEFQRALDLGRRFHAAGKFPEAEAAYRESLARIPDDPTALHMLGLLLFQAGRTADGLPLIARSVEAAGDSASMRFNYGNALLAENDPAGAAVQYRRALELEPNNPDVLSNLSVALCKQHLFNDAVVVARLALARRPSAMTTIFNLAQALRGQGEVALAARRYDEAADHFRQALKLDARHADAHIGMARVLAQQQNPRAEEHFRAALAIEPSSFEACAGLAEWLDRAQRHPEAAQFYERALGLRPDQSDTRANLAALYGRTGHPDRAIAIARQVLERNPAHIPAAATLGAALSQTGRNDEAAAVLLDALERLNLTTGDPSADPGLTAAERTHVAALLSNLFLLRHYEESYDPEKLTREQKLFGRIIDRPDALPAFDLSERPRLRIGYVSGDFRRHAVASFIEPILENHDPAGFEIFCYSSAEAPDEMTERIRRHAHHWREINSLRDDEVVDMVRNDRIDILVDLSGHTGNNRLPVFGRRPAPVQVTYLGFPGSTGLSSIDFRITDAHADPPGLTERFHQEKLFRLPRAFYCFRPHEDAPAVSPSPAGSNGFVTFASLNVFRKVTPRMMRLWAGILAAVPGSHLCMITDPGADDAVRAIFGAAGVASDRLELLQRRSLEGYLKRFAAIDIQLDSYPYNGHTTTCDCIWMGVPVVTLAGNTSVSRSGVSVLTNVGHPGWIAAAPDEYTRIAIELAGDRPRLAGLRRTLRSDMQKSPITDAVRITRDLEAAFRTMWNEKLAQASR